MSFFVDLLFHNIVTVIIFFVSFGLYREYQKRRKLPPGPWPLPFVGSLFLMMSKDKRETFRKLRSQYGDLVSCSVGGQQILIVSGVNMLHEVFVNHGKYFDKRPQVFTILKVGQAKAVVTSSGEIWKEHRAFLVANMKELGIGKTKFEGNVTEELKPFLEVLQQTNGQDFDPRHCVQTATSNIICSISFGTRFNYDDPEFVDLLEIFDSNMALAGSTAIVNYFPFLENMPGDPFKCGQCLENVAKVQAILSAWIEHHKRTMNPEEPRDFIDYYLIEMQEKYDKKESTTMDDSQLLKFVGDLFVGGTETTATTIRWALMFLVHHPEVQSKMYEEIMKTLGSRTQLSILDKEKMPYTSAVILESQRLGDIAPFSLPHSNFEDVEIGDYVIPAGTLLIPNINSVHMDPNVWEKPEEFRPSRFLDENGKVVNKKELMPFFIGPRMCPGRTLGKMEVFHFLTSIVQNFEILQAKSEGLPAYEGHIGITYVPHPHKMRFVSRGSGVHNPAVCNGEGHSVE